MLLLVNHLYTFCKIVIKKLVKTYAVATKSYVLTNVRYLVTDTIITVIHKFNQHSNATGH